MKESGIFCLSNINVGSYNTKHPVLPPGNWATCAADNLQPAKQSSGGQQGPIWESIRSKTDFQISEVFPVVISKLCLFNVILIITLKKITNLHFMTCLNFHVGICIFPLTESVSQHLRSQEFGRLTIISVTHHLHTLEYCDMVVHLKNGGSIDRIERLELALEKSHLVGGGFAQLFL